MGKVLLSEGEGLWIFPCEAIHTFGMNIPIDVVFLNKTHHVTAVREELRPNRIAVSFRATSVLELAAGSVERGHIRRGDALELTRETDGGPLEERAD